MVKLFATFLFLVWALAAAAQIGTPKSVKVEHDALHARLVKIVAKAGPVQAPARRVADALHRHFGKEEELAMPLLGLLAPASKGGKLPQKALEMVEQLRREMPKMLEEHKEIVKHLKALEAAARKANDQAALSFARDLMNHAQFEEEVLYPAALLLGRLR